MHVPPRENAVCAGVWGGLVCVGVWVEGGVVWVRRVVGLRVYVYARLGGWFPLMENVWRARRVTWLGKR